MHAQAPSGNPTPVRGRNGLAWLATAFIFLSLLALLIVPYWAAVRVGEARDLIFDVAEPARKQVDDMLIAHTALLAATRSYQITGSPQFRTDHQRALADWDRAIRELRPLLGRLDPALQARLQTILAENAAFSERATAFMTGKIPPTAYLEAFGEQHANFERLHAALIALRSDIDVRIRTERDRVIHYEHLAVGLTVVLAFAALVSAVMVTWFAVNRRHLIGRIEQQLVQEGALRNRAEAAVAERDELLGIVSHDLRNPLTAIVTSAAMLQRRLPADLPERKFVEAIERATTFMTRLIQDLLDVTKLEGQQHLALNRQSVDVGPVIQEAIDVARGPAVEKEVTLAADLPATRTVVIADRDRLLQILGNLLSNAIKFTPVGGRVTVRARAVANGVEVAVSDTGPGITPGNLSHVFDRFWQAKQTQRAGAGLGLAISKGLVEAHGGRIWVASTPGQGATFHFTLPTVVLERQGASR